MRYLKVLGQFFVALAVVLVLLAGVVMLLPDPDECGMSEERC